MNLIRKTHPFLCLKKCDAWAVSVRESRLTLPIHELAQIRTAAGWFSLARDQGMTAAACPAT